MRPNALSCCCIVSTHTYRPTKWTTAMRPSALPISDLRCEWSSRVYASAVPIRSNCHSHRYDEMLKSYLESNQKLDANDTRKNWADKPKFRTQNSKVLYICSMDSTRILPSMVRTVEKSCTEIVKLLNLFIVRRSGNGTKNCLNSSVQ